MAHTWKNLLVSGIADSPDALLITVLVLLGLSVLSFWLNIFGAVWASLFRPGFNLKRKYGDWSIVTGATDGIGRSYCKQLAKKKINVILVSRSQEKLVEQATELESKYGIETKTFAIDLTSSDLSASLSKLEALISDLNVGILINNAGMSYPYAQFLHEIDQDLVSKIIRINVEAVALVTKTVLPGMVARKKGAIVNIGSGAATVLPSDPLYAVYAGTKGFVDEFSKTLAVEYKHKGIDVQCQVPLYVATKLAKIRHASLTCPSADTFAKYGVNWIGRESVCAPYPVHAFMWWVISSTPESIMNAIRMSQNVSIRKRALAKEAKKKAQ